MTSPTPNSPSEVLEVPILPPPNSRFILPPPKSDLLNRLQAFLPQIKSANELLESRPPLVEGEEVEEEGVIVQIIDSSDEEEDSSDEDDEEEDDEEEEVEENVEGSEQSVGGTLKKLMEIGSGTKLVKKGSEEVGSGKKVVGIVEMDS